MTNIVDFLNMGVKKLKFEKLLQRQYTILIQISIEAKGLLFLKRATSINQKAEVERVLGKIH